MSPSREFKTVKIAMAMGCNHHHRLLSHGVRTSLYTLCNFPLILTKKLKFLLPPLTHCSKRYSSRTAVSASCTSFTWDDVFQISQSKNVSSDLQGFFDKIKICNRGSENRYEFIPFVVEEQIVGYVHNGFADHLRSFQDVFTFPKDNSHGSHFGGHITLHPMLKTPEHKTNAVEDVVKCLGEELIPGIRNEAYGVHMNGYVERDGQKYLWIGKRSELKPTYPGMLDHLVAGGLPHEISCGENLVKECEEEAGIPSSISNEAVPVGAVSYMDIDGYRYKRDVLFCYDLKLPKDFIPKNQDGEVESFKLIPAALVANVIQRTHFFKPNCNLVIIDFLFRHGYIKPEDFGYLTLLQSLRSGDCS